MANKLANYVYGAYYVWTTGRFSANFMPMVIKTKKPPTAKIAGDSRRLPFWQDSKSYAKRILLIWHAIIFWIFLC